jgi:hypothetical protein
MKKITAILAILLFAITTHAQVKIDFNGFHCNQETNDGSGSDEVYFIFNVYRDGNYINSVKYPNSSYMGGVDAGGTYGKGNYTIYQGPSGRIMIEIIAFEWDNGNPDANLEKYKQYYRDNSNCLNVRNVAFYKNRYSSYQYIAGTNNDIPSCRLYVNNANEKGYYFSDDIYGIDVITFSQDAMNDCVQNIVPFPIISNDKEIDNVPYNIKQKEISNYFGSHKNGKLSAFFTILNDNPEVTDVDIRKLWNENNWIGKYISNKNQNPVSFENASIYKSKNKINVIQGAIREKYRQKGVFEKVGNLESNEMDVTDQKWKDAGYLKFSKGYIVWKPSSCLALTNEEFDTGPKSFAEIVTETKMKEPVKTGGILISKNAKTGEDNRETAIAMITNYMATNPYAKENLGSLRNDQGHPKQTTNKNGKTGWYWATNQNDGFVFYTPFNNQVHAVDRGFRKIHAANKTEHGVYGFAISEPFGIKNGGVVQQFEFGNMYYNPNAAETKFELHGTYGKINEKYGSQGWENGKLGYPINDEYSCPIKGAKKGNYYAEVGHAQFFEGGAIWYNIQNNTIAIVPGGPIIERYKQTGWEIGDLGYPKTDAYEWKNKGGMVQSFEEGDIRWKNGATEAFSIKNKNNIYSIYLQNQDKLGFPTIEERNTGGTISQTFENGTIVGDKVILK